MSSPPQHRLASLSYRPDIDGLRAVAILAGVGFHAFPEWIRGGFIGIDLFFVISGYLISAIIFGSLEKGGFSYALFYARRVKRIFPALLLVLFASFIIGRLVLISQEYRQLGKHIATGTVFLSNFLLWSEAGYFDNATETKPLANLWSLGVEEQFYVLWPLLLGLAWRHKKSFLALTSYIAIASFAVSIYTIHNDPVAAYYSPFCRFWELMLGGILAYLTAHKPECLTGKPAWRAALGLMLIAISLALFHKELTFPGWWALLPAVGAFLVISAGHDAWLNRNLLSHPVLVWIGLISYPLYLWHWPLLSFAQIVESRMPSVETRAMLVLASFVLAWLTYRFIEKPVRYGEGDPYKMAALLCALLMGLGCIGYWAFEQGEMNPDDIVFRSVFHNTGNAADKQTADEKALEKYFEILKTQPRYLDTLIANRRAGIRAPYCNFRTSPHLDQTFEEYRPGFSRCLKMSADKKNVLIIGDSHAADLYSALSSTHPELNFLQATGSFCDPVTGSYKDPGDGCAKMIEFAMDFTRNHKLDAVILAARWNTDYSPLASDIRRLKANGQKVILAGPPLQYSADVPNIVARGQGEADFKRYMDSFILPENIRKSRDMREFAQKNGVSYIDRIYYFCKSGCPVLASDGQLLFIDYYHLSAPGAAFLGNRLLEENVLRRIIDSPAPIRLPEDTKGADEKALEAYSEILRHQPDYLNALIAKRDAGTRAPYCLLKLSQTFINRREEIARCLKMSADKKNVLIIGDSHAADLYSALSSTHPEFNFLQATGSFCDPATKSYRSFRGDCAELIKYAIDFTKENRLDAVLLAGGWNVNYPDAAFEINKLRGNGQKVILVGPPLQYSADVSRLIARWNGDSDFKYYMDSFLLRDNFNISRDMKAFAKAHGVSYIDRIYYFCKSGCPVLAPDGQLLFADYYHLSAPGAAFLGNQLLKENVLQRIIDSPTPLQLPEGQQRQP